MKQTTLCYIEKAGKYLMLHRVKKEVDCNKDKWIGVGGKFEEDETPEECVVREVYEETGLTITSYDYRGLITFVSDEFETEYMHLFTASEFHGDMVCECSEGNLEWVEKSQIEKLNLWEGDKIFLKRLNVDKNFFTLKLRYEGDRLVESVMREYGEK